MRKRIAIGLIACLLLMMAGCQTPQGDGAGVLPDDDDKLLTESDYVAFEQAVTEEAIYAVSTDYVQQLGGNDLLQATVQNNAGVTITKMHIAFMAWDKERQPILLKSASGATEDSYIKIVECSDITLKAGALWNDNYGYPVSKECNNIVHVKAFALAYETADGTVWENPLYSRWRKAYEGRALKAYMVTTTTDGSATDTTTTAATTASAATAA